MSIKLDERKPRLTTILSANGSLSSTVSSFLKIKSIDEEVRCTEGDAEGSHHISRPMLTC